jgi:hypothetical protein
MGAYQRWGRVIDLVQEGQLGYAIAGVIPRVGMVKVGVVQVGAAGGAGLPLEMCLVVIFSVPGVGISSANLNIAIGEADKQEYDRAVLVRTVEGAVHTERDDLAGQGSSLREVGGCRS